MRSLSLSPIRNARASLLLALALVLSFSTRAVAQKYVTAYVTVPFAFDVGGEVFAAGDYVIDSAVPGSISIRSKDGRHIRVVPTIVDGDPVKKSEARLIFVKRDGKYVLHSLWGVLGKRTVTPELAEQSVAEKDTTAIPLTYTPGGGANPTPVSETTR